MLNTDNDNSHNLPFYTLNNLVMFSKAIDRTNLSVTPLIISTLLDPLFDTCFFQSALKKDFALLARR